jgi:hypothetical protein
MLDSVPLLDPVYDDPKTPRLQVSNIKLIIALFVIFIIVVSDVFTNSIIAGFGDSAMKGRSPTSWGIILQGIFLVIFYIIAIYLTEHQIL